MFDTMTITKVGGALCGALLIFLLLNWAAEGIYSTEGGHGDHAEAAYVIEVESEESHAAEEEEDTVDVAALVAAADAEIGAKTFSKKCKTCHKLEDGVNAAGPSLFGIVDKDIASDGAFRYSGPLTALEGNWTIEALNGFLTKPKEYVPGTKMGFAGLKKEADRANLIAYLATIGN